MAGTLRSDVKKWLESWRLDGKELFGNDMIRMNDFYDIMHEIDALMKRFKSFMKQRVVSYATENMLRSKLASAERARDAVCAVLDQHRMKKKTKLNVAYQTIREPFLLKMTAYVAAHQAFRDELQKARKSCKFTDQEDRNKYREKNLEKRKATAAAVREAFQIGDLYQYAEKVYSISDVKKEHVVGIPVKDAKAVQITESTPTMSGDPWISTIGYDVNVVDATPASDAKPKSFYLGKGKIYTTKTGQKACWIEESGCEGGSYTYTITLVQPGKNRIRY